MFYDSWVLTGFLVANISLVVMTAVVYVYQWNKERKSHKTASKHHSKTKITPTS